MDDVEEESTNYEGFRDKNNGVEKFRSAYTDSALLQVLIVFKCLSLLIINTVHNTTNDEHLYRSYFFLAISYL